MTFKDEKFVSDFIKLAKEHNRCLETKEYSKRSRINKKLMSMLNVINSLQNPEKIISEIIDCGDEYAILWIANYAFKNKMCVDIVRQKLKEIMDRKSGADSVTAWALMRENNVQ